MLIQAQQTSEIETCYEITCRTKNLQVLEQKIYDTVIDAIHQRSAVYKQLVPVRVSVLLPKNFNIQLSNNSLNKIRQRFCDRLPIEMGRLVLAEQGDTIIRVFLKPIDSSSDFFTNLGANMNKQDLSKRILDFFKNAKDSQEVVVDRTPDRIDPVSVKPSTPTPSAVLQIQPGMTVMDIKQGIQDGCRRFYAECVAPAVEISPGFIFALKNLKIIISDNKIGALDTLRRLPTLMQQNMVVQILKEINSDLFSFEQFYGIDFIASETQIDGYNVDLIFNFGSDGRISCPMYIVGDFIARDKTQQTKGVVAIDNNQTATTQPQSSENTAKVAEATKVNKDDDSGKAESEVEKDKTSVSPRSRNNVPNKEETFVVKKSVRSNAIATVVILPYNGEERRFPLYPEQFPLEISRQPSMKHSIEIAPLEHPKEGSKVSRNKHIIINELVDNLRFNIENHGANGSYIEGKALPERFTLGWDTWLNLGDAGEGSVAIKIVKN